MALRPAAGASISWKLNSYREGQHADHGHGNQPYEPFHAIEPEQPALAPNVRGHDTLPGLQTASPGQSTGKHNS